MPATTPEAPQPPEKTQQEILAERAAKIASELAAKRAKMAEEAEEREKAEKEEKRKKTESKVNKLLNMFDQFKAAELAKFEQLNEPEVPAETMAQPVDAGADQSVAEDDKVNFKGYEISGFHQPFLNGLYEVCLGSDKVGGRHTYKHKFAAAAEE